MNLFFLLTHCPSKSWTRDSNLFWSAPENLVNTSSPLKKTKVGTALISNSTAASLLSSTSTFPKATSGYFPANSSYTGLIALHGGHLQHKSNMEIKLISLSEKVKITNDLPDGSEVKHRLSVYFTELLSCLEIAKVDYRHTALTNLTSKLNLVNIPHRGSKTCRDHS